MNVLNIKPAIFVILFSILLSSESNAQETSTALPEQIITPEDLSNLLGEWTGRLTYADYSTNKPYTMPVNLIVEPGKNANQLLLFYIYPNEPKANSKDKIVVSKDGMNLNKQALKSKQGLSNGQIQITTEYIGKDNKQEAVIRNIYIWGAKQFIIRKEVRFEPAGEWIKRNEFSFER